MKQSLTFLLILLALPSVLRAQVKIGDNLNNVNANSLLELESTTKALLLPRLDNNQIQAMQNVPAGMLVYSSTDNVLMIRTNTGWTTLALAANAASAVSPFTTSGSTIYTTASKVGIGTSNPFSRLANNSGNTSGSDGQGGNPGSISWAASQGGYVGQIYNGGTGAYNNGLVVKVNSTTATALDVSQGAQSGSATPLLTVKSDGKVGIKKADPSVELDVNGEINANVIYAKQDLVGDGDLYIGRTINANKFNIGVQYLYEDFEAKAGFISYLRIGCPSGTKVIGGGGGHRDSNLAAEDIEVAYSGPDPDNPNNWKLIIDNNGSSSRMIREYVICAKVN